MKLSVTGQPGLRTTRPMRSRRFLKILLLGWFSRGPASAGCVESGAAVGDAAVAQAPVAAGDPVDGAFDHGPVTAVDRLEGGVGGAARCARSRASWWCRVTRRPAFAVVHRARSGQPVQRPANAATRRPSFAVRAVTVWPAGQLTVPASWSMVKSSAPNPPGMFGRVGHGLMTGVCPAPVTPASRSAVP